MALDLARMAQGYAYVLTHPGTPCIFLDHLWTDGMLKPSLWRRLRSLLQVLLLFGLMLADLDSHHIHCDRPCQNG